MYNAMEDAQKLRMARFRIKELIGKMSHDRLLLMVVQLISPAYAGPILKGLRNALINRTDDELDRLIADITR